MLKSIFQLIIVTLLLPTLTFSSEKSFDGYIIKYKTLTQKSNINFNVKGSNLSKLKMKVVKNLNDLIMKGVDKSMDEIEYIEPNWIVHTLDIPTDNLYSNQWGMKKIEAEKAWEITQGSKNTIVAVIDTGIDYTHPDLKNQMWVNELEKNGVKGVDDDGNGYIDDVYGYDFANNDNDPKDDHSHGTHCAGVIGAEHNNGGVVGLNSRIKLMALKFLTKDGRGSSEGAISSIIYAVDNGAKILSNSWGGGNSSQAMRDAINYAKDHGVLFVAAAGNEYNNNDLKPSYPASYKISNVISVAASTPEDTKASFSNFGKSVHIAAPGTDILSTVIDGGYKKYNGTSMACPHVSGALALLISNENISISEAKKRLILTSDYIPALEEKTYNGGRLNVYNLLKDIHPQRPLPPNPSKWIKEKVCDIFTKHPYKNKDNYKFEINIPHNIKYIRIHFTKFISEKRYDSLKIKDSSGKILDILSGNLGESVYTKSIRANNLNSPLILEFKSDSSKVYWGFDMDYFEYQ